jgi:hypothetical protein
MQDLNFGKIGLPFLEMLRVMITGDFVFKIAAIGSIQYNGVPTVKRGQCQSMA